MRTLPAVILLLSVGCASTTANQPFLLVLNREIVAVEVVHTPVGSIGLAAAVPITTAIGPGAGTH